MSSEHNTTRDPLAYALTMRQVDLMLKTAHKLYSDPLIMNIPDDDDRNIVRTYREITLVNSRVLSGHYGLKMADIVETNVALCSSDSLVYGSNDSKISYTIVDPHLKHESGWTITIIFADQYSESRRYDDSIAKSIKVTVIVTFTELLRTEVF